MGTEHRDPRRVCDSRWFNHKVRSEQKMRTENVMWHVGERNRGSLSGGKASTGWFLRQALT